MAKDQRVMEALGIFIQVWHRDARYAGVTYHPTGKDLGAVRDLLSLSDVPAGTIALHTQEYLRDDWWYPQRHLASGLFRNFMRYAPKTSLRTTVAPMKIRCDLCEQVHGPNESCNTDALDRAFRKGAT